MARKSESPWKTGRGKLGVFAPLLGAWRTQADTEMGPLTCERTFETILGGKYVQLTAAWTFASAKGAKPRAPYQELCLFGPHKEHGLGFWSFTSDGKRSEGRLFDATDIHAQALCFAAKMDAGFARQAYWPGDDGAVHWCVESRTRKGWNRFVHHTYQTG